MYKRLLVLAILVSISASAFADPQVGTETITLHKLSGVSASGNYLPSYNGQCHQLYQSYDNSNFTLNYSIDKETKIESATAFFAGHTFQLYPMGLGNQYAFMSDGAQGDILLVSATLDESLSTMTALVKLQGNDGFNCALE